MKALELTAVLELASRAAGRTDANVDRRRRLRRAASAPRTGARPGRRAAAQGRRRPRTWATTTAAQGDLMFRRIGQAIKGAALLDFAGAFGLGLKYMVRPKATMNYPYERNPQSPALPRRARAAPLSQRRGALHRLQAVRGDLPGPGHHHRGRAARRRQPPHHPLRHRHGEVHLLRPVPGGLPGGRHRRGAELRVRHRDPRRALLRQGSGCSTNGDRWEREIAKNLELDAPYR